MIFLARRPPFLDDLPIKNRDFGLPKACAPRRVIPQRSINGKPGSPSHHGCFNAKMC